MWSRATHISHQENGSTARSASQFQESSGRVTRWRGFRKLGEPARLGRSPSKSLFFQISWRNMLLPLSFAHILAKASDLEQGLTWHDVSDWFMECKPCHRFFTEKGFSSLCFEFRKSILICLTIPSALETGDFAESLHCIFAGFQRILSYLSWIVFTRDWLGKYYLFNIFREKFTFSTFMILQRNTSIILTVWQRYIPSPYHMLKQIVKGGISLYLISELWRYIILKHL